MKDEEYFCNKEQKQKQLAIILYLLLHNNIDLEFISYTGNSKLGLITTTQATVYLALKLILVNILEFPTKSFNAINFSYKDVLNNKNKQREELIKYIFDNNKCNKDNLLKCLKNDLVNRVNDKLQQKNINSNALLEQDKSSPIDNITFNTPYYINNVCGFDDTCEYTENEDCKYDYNCKYTRFDFNLKNINIIYSLAGLWLKDKKIFKNIDFDTIETVSDWKTIEDAFYSSCDKQDLMVYIANQILKIKQDEDFILFSNMFLDESKAINYLISLLIFILMNAEIYPRFSIEIDTSKVLSIKSIMNKSAESVKERKDFSPQMKKIANAINSCIIKEQKCIFIDDFKKALWTTKTKQRENANISKYRNDFNNQFKACFNVDFDALGEMDGDFDEFHGKWYPINSKVKNFL